MDDLFDQVKKELEEDGGHEAESKVEKPAPEQSAQDLIDDISWDDVAGELEEQRDMIKDEAAGKAAASGGGVGDSDDGLLSSLNVEQRQQLPANIGFILDIPLQLSVEIGRARMIINDLLQLGQGSVIELEKLAGEPFDVLVNNKLIARGEVVVVNEKFGIRLTDIISPTERIEQLK
ncbi:MAG: flagellar motor switch protein FliN [Deltaproteobacteria bacterium]|nr:flagellar motor switch protein FliN [Deltaproteobacteria bacterium]